MGNEEGLNPRRHIGVEVQRLTSSQTGSTEFSFVPTRHHNEGLCDHDGPSSPAKVHDWASGRTIKWRPVAILFFWSNSGGLINSRGVLFPFDCFKRIT